MNYKDISNITNEQVDSILKTWGDNAVHYAENHHGTVYWNKSTGEILWYANSEDESNASVLETK